MIQSNKLSFEEMNEIVSDMKNRGNSDLTKVMDFLSEDFEETKEKLKAEKEMALLEAQIELEKIKNRLGA